MYLARHRIKGKTHYSIRESYSDQNDTMRSRELVYLGTDPTQYIIYPGGNSFYIDEMVEDRIQDKGVRPKGDELEDIFWRFVRPDIQRALEHFRGRSRKPTARPVQIRSGDQFHLFDRRRMHFLRYGQMDQGNIGRVSPRLYKALCSKSRDEIEQYFIDAEMILKAHERKSYVFVIFDLQRHFGESFAKTMPQGLDQNVVDEFFLKDVCRLNSDRKFWTDRRTGDVLSEYLIRYVLMFFDNDYGRSSYLDDMIFNWMNSRRDFRSPEKPRVSVQEASTVFGVTETELQEMSCRELTRLYRKKAMKHHPDTGGDQERFVALTEAYQDMLHKKK